jgi:glycosyltransferase involved in cell wall biosynthesis
LKIQNPDIVVTTSFNPTMLIGWIYTRFYKKKHIVMSDGWLKSEEKLSKIHFIIRKIVYRYADAFIGASKHTLSMFEQYGVSKEKIFHSCLCIDNKFFRQFVNNKKKYDVMFSGQFIERKLPFFFIEVVKKLKRLKRNLNVLLIGSGPLLDIVIIKLKQSKINYVYPGFVQQKELPKYYASSKILLFPTESDPWGVVANEACAAGVPVITCMNAGVANDLIIDGFNGYVLPLDVDLWVYKILKLLGDISLYKKMSRSAIEKVRDYNSAVAAEGFIKACEKSLER